MGSLKNVATEDLLSTLTDLWWARGKGEDVADKLLQELRTELLSRSASPEPTAMPKCEKCEAQADEL